MFSSPQPLKPLTIFCCVFVCFLFVFMPSPSALRGTRPACWAEGNMGTTSSRYHLNICSTLNLEKCRAQRGRRAGRLYLLRKVSFCYLVGSVLTCKFADFLERQWVRACSQADLPSPLQFFKSSFYPHRAFFLKGQKSTASFHLPICPEFKNEQPYISLCLVGNAWNFVIRHELSLVSRLGPTSLYPSLLPTCIHCGFFGHVCCTGVERAWAGGRLPYSQSSVP